MVHNNHIHVIQGNTHFLIDLNIVIEKTQLNQNDINNIVLSLTTINI